MKTPPAHFERQRNARTAELSLGQPVLRRLRQCRPRQRRPSRSSTAPPATTIPQAARPICPNVRSPSTAAPWFRCFGVTVRRCWSRCSRKHQVAAFRGRRNVRHDRLYQFATKIGGALPGDRMSQLPPPLYLIDFAETVFVFGLILRQTVPSAKFPVQLLTPFPAVV